MADGVLVQPIEKGGQWLLRMAEDARHATLELLEASQVCQMHRIVACALEGRTAPRRVRRRCVTMTLLCKFAAAVAVTTCSCWLNALLLLGPRCSVTDTLRLSFP